MAKKNSVQNGCEISVYFNQLREEVLNRYLGSYANRVPKRTDNIVKESDCCDRLFARIPCGRKGGFAA